MILDSLPVKESIGRNLAKRLAAACMPVGISNLSLPNTLLINYLDSFLYTSGWEIQHQKEIVH